MEKILCYYFELTISLKLILDQVFGGQVIPGLNRLMDHCHYLKVVSLNTGGISKCATSALGAIAVTVFLNLFSMLKYHLVVKGWKYMVYVQ